MFPHTFLQRQNVNDQQRAENGIYLADLDNGVSQELLYLSLKDFGNLKYLKLHRFPFLGISRQFAFAYFEKEEQAQRAQKALNHKQILKNHIRTTKIQQQLPDKQANLLFMGFKSDVNLHAVDEFFANWGSLFSVKFSFDDNKVNRGYGWVQFDTVEGANKCLQECESQQGLKFVDGKGQTHIIQVKKFVAKGNQDRSDIRVNVYIKNFGLQSDYNFDLDNEGLLNQQRQKEEEKLRKYFSEFGQIGSIFVNVDRQRKTPFAFVSFVDHRNAQEVVEKFTKNNVEVKDPFGTGQTIYVNWAQRKSDRVRWYQGPVLDRYVFIQNLKLDVTDERIKTVFRAYGDIVTVRLDKLPYTGFTPNIRIGYVVFANAAEAKKVILAIERFRNDPNMNFTNEFEKTKVTDIISLFEGDYIVTNLFKPSWKKFPPVKRNQPRIQMANPVRVPFMPYGRLPHPRQGGMRQQQFPYMMPPPQQFLPPQMMAGGAFPQIPFMIPPPQFGAPPFIPQQQYPPIRPQQQQPQQPFLPPQTIQQVILPYNQRPDYLDLLKEKDKLPQADQRKKIGVILLNRVKESKPTLPQAQIGKIVGMLIDETQFEIDECYQLISDEKELAERIQEAIDIFNDEEQENE